MTKYIAVLTDANVMIGSTEVADDTPGIDPGDLPQDGRYKWDGERETWVPLGHGFGKVKTGNPPASFEMALLSIIHAMGDDAPADALSWAEWFGGDIGVRERESNEARLIRRRAGL
jgi:hypothetical protein